MTIHKYPIDLGSPLADKKNSPIVSDFTDEQELIDPEVPDERVCYFNGISYAQGTFIKSGTSILQCDRGVWVEADISEEY